MSTTNTLSSGLPDAEHSAQLRKAVDRRDCRHDHRVV